MKRKGGKCIFYLSYWEIACEILALKLLEKYLILIGKFSVTKFVDPLLDQSV